MAELLRVACLQMNSSDSVGDNLAFIRQNLEAVRAPDQLLDIVLLPENFAQMQANRHEQYYELDGDGVVQNTLAELALEFNTCIIGGSLAVCDQLDEKPLADENPLANKNPYARCLVYSSTGERVAHYDKLHLFDSDVSAQRDSAQAKRYRESDSYTAGCLNDHAVKAVRLPGRDVGIGLTICYDLRFPELYKSLAERGAQLITVPSAFTTQTGQAHWHTLLRARAIENQVYILAAAQVGKHASGRSTYGHSLVIDPWGSVIAEKPTGVGLLIAEIDLTYIDKLRADMPIAQHRRLV